MKTSGLFRVAEDLAELLLVSVELLVILRGFWTFCARILWDRMLWDKAETRLNPFPHPFSAVFIGDSVLCDSLEVGKDIVADYVLLW